MNMKKVLLLALVSIGLIGSTVAIAAQQGNTTNNQQGQHKCNGKCKH